MAAITLSFRTGSCSHHAPKASSQPPSRRASNTRSALTASLVGAWSSGARASRTRWSDRRHWSASAPLGRRRHEGLRVEASHLQAAEVEGGRTFESAGTQPLETGHREQDRVVASFAEPPNAGQNVPPERLRPQVGAKMPEPHLPANGGGADERAFGDGENRSGAAGIGAGGVVGVVDAKDEGVGRVPPLGHRRHRELLG